MRHRPRVVLVVLAAVSLVALIGCSGSPHASQATQSSAAPPTSLPAMTEAQVQEIPAHDKESLADYYGRKGRAIGEQLAEAKKLESNKQWGQAAYFYQHLLEGNRDRMLPAGAAGEAGHYENVEYKVYAAMAQWPDEGIRAYQEIYGAAANTMLQSAGPGDLQTLDRVWHRYFFTDAGREAGKRLMALATERNEWGFASRVGAQILQFRPRPEDRHELIAQVAEDAAHAQHDGLDHSTDSWQLSIGGNAERNQIAAGDLWPDSPLYHIDLAQPNASDAAAHDFEKHLIEAYGSSERVLPAIDRGELYFQNGRRLWAVDLRTGKPLPGWAKTYPASGQFALPDVTGLLNEPQFAVTLTDQYVLAVMGQPDWLAPQEDQPQPNVPRVVCLARDTGKPLWIAVLKGANAVSSPLVAGNNVLVLGRCGTPDKGESLYLVCFDLTDGTYKWNCYLGSADKETIQLLEMSSGESLTSPLSFSNGLAYAVTNMGGLAAIDPYDGTLAWVNLYRSKPAAAEARPPWDPKTPEPAIPNADNPPIVNGGKLFMIPADSDVLLVYDADTGADMKRINLKDLANDSQDLYQDMQSPLSFNTLLAVDGNFITLAGRHDKAEQLCCFDWTKFTDNDPGPSLEWASAPMDALAGRCFVTADSILIPTAKQLIRIDRAGEIIQEDYPPDDRSWDTDFIFPLMFIGATVGAGEGPGNALMIAGHVIIAGEKRVTVYSTKPAEHPSR